MDRALAQKGNRWALLFWSNGCQHWKQSQSQRSESQRSENDEDEDDEDEDDEDEDEEGQGP